MRSLLFFILIVNIYCTNNSSNKSNNIKSSRNSIDSFSSARQYDSLLNDLKKNYVLNIEPAFRKELFKFYNVNEDIFLKDSIVYFSAVARFFESDSSIIDYLLSFKSDSSFCQWIYTPHPFSSTVKRWESNFNKRDGATILLFDYLNMDINKENSITTEPEIIESILKKYNLDNLEILSKTKVD